MRGITKNRSLHGSNLAFWLATLLAMPLPGYAADTEETKLTGNWDQDFHALCDGVPSRAQVERMKRLDPNVNINPRFEHCDAARGAYDARAKNEALIWVWSGVAAVCTGACIAGFTGNGIPIICQSVNVAGGVTDAAVTGEFAGMMASLGSTVIGLGTATSAPGGLLGVADPGRNEASADAGEGGEGATAEGSDEPQGVNDIGACITAVTAAGQAVIKGVSLDSFNRTIHTSVEEASKLSPTPGSQLVKNGNGSFDISDHTPRTTTASGSRETGGMGSSSSTDTSPLPAECGGVQPGAVHSAIAACATALDSNLPAAVRDPSFQTQLQNRLGQDLSGLSRLASENSTADVLAQAMGAGMPAKTQAALASMVNDLASRSPATAGVGTYAGGGGRRGGGGASDPFGGALSGLMDKLMAGKPGAKDGDPHAGVKRVAEAVKARGPASVSEDRNLGIFDRISYRYYALAYQGFGHVAAPVAPARAAATPPMRTLPSARRSF